MQTIICLPKSDVKFLITNCTMFGITVKEVKDNFAVNGETHQNVNVLLECEDGSAIYELGRSMAHCKIAEERSMKFLPFTEERRKIREEPILKEWNLLVDIGWQEYLKMRESGQVYYGVFHEDGDMVASGTNCSVLEDVRLSLVDLHQYKKKTSLENIIDSNGYSIQVSANEFPELF